MNYNQAILKINSLNKFGIKPGLERIKRFLDFIENPHKKLKFIHVAGTNGKGSVCFMLANILKKGGYKTGLYISPSINDFRERIQINGNLISEFDVCRIFSDLEKFFPYFKEDMLSEFEIITAMAFKYFEEKNCDIVVLETGMGGRLDATNVIESSFCSIITTISCDHTQFLGNNILDIAKEKFGIIKPNSKLIIGSDQDENVYNLARNICKNLNSKLLIANSNKIEKFKNIDFKKSQFIYENKEMEVNLLGKHQKRNVATVMTTINSLSEELKIKFSDLKDGLQSVKVPCRMEVLNYNPLIILDASHNVESIKALADFIQENLAYKNIWGIFSMLADKDLEGAFKFIGKHLSKVLILKSGSSRGMDVNEMKKIIKKYNDNVKILENFDEELKNALYNISKEDVLIIFGSFSIMKDAKKFLNSVFLS